MEAKELSAETRSVHGKGAARQLRAQQKMPAVFYGPGVDPVSLTLSPKELAAALSTDYRRNQLLKLTVNGEARHALVQELQVHPVTRQLLHADLYGLEPDTVVERKVPFVVSGRAAGVVAGGELRVLFRHLSVRGPASSIPSSIAVDVTSLNMGDTIKAKDLQLPEGVQIIMAPDRNVLTVAAGRRRAAAAGTEEGADAKKGKK